MHLKQSKLFERNIVLYHIMGLMMGEEHTPGERHTMAKRVAINLYKLVVNSYTGIVFLTIALTLIDHYFPPTMTTKTNTKKVFFCLASLVMTLDVIIKILVLKNGSKIVEEIRDLMRTYKHVKININSIVSYLVFKSMHLSSYLIMSLIEIHRYQVSIILLILLKMNNELIRNNRA